MSECCINTCLYFTLVKLNRKVSKLADDAFKSTGLPPTYAFLLAQLRNHEAVSPKELSTTLCLAPSTITRFLDKLEANNYINRTFDGKSAKISLTAKGHEIQVSIDNAWDELRQILVTTLGEEESHTFVKHLKLINDKFCDTNDDLA